MMRAFLLLLAALPAWAQCTGYAKAIPVQFEAVTANVGNVAAVISVTSKLLATTANGGLSQSAGFDICPSDLANSVAFPIQIRSYTATTGALVAAVKVPGLALAPTNGLLWIGKASVTDPSSTAVWNANYVQSYPLQENCTPSGSTAGCYLDATSGAHSGTSGVNPTQVAGLVGNAQSFNGTTQYVPVVNGLTAGTTATLSAWFKTTNLATAIIVDQRGDTNNGCAIFLNASGFAVAVCNPIAYTGSVNLADGNWHQITVTSAAGIVSEYVDGVFAGSASGSFVGFSAGPMWIGRYRVTPFFPWLGLIQEVRVSNVALSAVQIKTDYDAFHAPATFFKLMNRTWGWAN